MWIELHDSARDHPKTIRLARRLGIAKVHALGHMCSLWTWCLRMSADGCLASFDVTDIEIGAEWEGTEGAFVEAAENVGFIEFDENDERVLHDWEDYAEHLKAAKRKKKERDRKRVERENKRAYPWTSKDVQGRPEFSGHVTQTDRPTDQTDQTDQTRPDQIPEPKAEVVSWPAAISTTADFEQAIAEWGWSVSGLSPRQRAKVSRITKAGVITRDEYEHAKASANGKDKPVAYFLSVVEGERKQATEEADKPSYPPKEPERSGCWARDLSYRSQRDE